MTSRAHCTLAAALNGDGFPDALGFWWQGDNRNGVDIQALINDQQGGFDPVFLGEYHYTNFNWPDPYFFMGLSNVLPSGNFRCQGQRRSPHEHRCEP